MLDNPKVYCTGFGDQAFVVKCNNADALALAKFLFTDFPRAEESAAAKRYTIFSDTIHSTWSLESEDEKLYQGASAYRLCYSLMNEVIFHCINTNDQEHALHSGAVWNDTNCIILPGKSGTGKSTLTAWLVANGFQYLTDELIFLAEDRTITPLTRPINLKVNFREIAWLGLAESNDQIIADDHGSMIPHRLINPIFSSKEQRVNHIVFPEYRAGEPAKLHEISPAKSCFNLIQSHVNARNLDGHGVSELADIVRECRSWQLTYGKTEDLPALFCQESGFLS